MHAPDAEVDDARGTLVAILESDDDAQVGRDSSHATASSTVVPVVTIVHLYSLPLPAMPRAPGR
jgi:hypothetical protein